MKKSPVKQTGEKQKKKITSVFSFQTSTSKEIETPETITKQPSLSKFSNGEDSINNTSDIHKGSLKKQNDSLTNLSKPFHGKVAERKSSALPKKKVLFSDENKKLESPRKNRALTSAIAMPPMTQQENKRDEGEDVPTSLGPAIADTAKATSSNLALLSQMAASTSNSTTRSSNIRVYARVRPINEVEQDLLDEGVGSLCVEYVNSNAKENNSIIIKNPNGNASNPFIFDRVFPSESAQESVYNVIGKEIIKDVLAGYNGTIFAYGQSGSGKTYSMYGSDIYDETTKGIIPRLIGDIFDHVDMAGENVTFQLKMSILQIYKEVIFDLITGDSNLKIKENPIRGIYVDKLTEVYVNSIENFMEYIDLAQENRIVSETKLNNTSSRSHSILIFEVTQTILNENFSKKGTLNLVDLAGSEKISKTGAVGETLEEAKKINLSLSALGHVIHSLITGADHIPYRDSKLTRILQESLGGNFKTSLVVTCSPHSYHLEETLSTLQFAQRAKTIKNKAKMNIKLTYEELQKIITQLRRSLAKANAEILRLKGLLPPGTEINFLPANEEMQDLPQDIEEKTMLNDLAKREKDTLSDLLVDENNLTLPRHAKGSHHDEISNGTNLFSNDEVSDIEKEKPSAKQSNVNDSNSASMAKSIKNSINRKEKERVNELETDKGKETKTSTIEQHSEMVKTPIQKRALNSIDEASANCPNCQRFIDKITKLREQLEKATNEIKEKDEIITTMEKVNNKNRHLDKLKTTNIFKSEKNDAGLQLKAINDLYEEIKTKLINIEGKQAESTKLDIKLSAFTDMNATITNNLKALFESNIKSTFEHSSNGHFLLLEGVTQMLVKTLGIYKDDTTSDLDYSAISETFKDKTGVIYDNIFQLIRTTIKPTSSSIPSKPNEISNTLVHFASMFIFSYIEEYVNIQIFNQLNYKINNQNKILRNMNIILVSIVEDLIKTNLDISQKYNTIGLEKFKASIADPKGYSMTFAGEVDFQDNVNKQSFANDATATLNNIRKRGRIMTIVSRKGLDAIKAAKERSEHQSFNAINVNTFGATSFINVINCPDVLENKMNLGEGNNSESGGMHFARDNFNKPTRHTSQFIVPCSNFGALIKKQEKKKSKLTMLKEFVIKSIRQTDDFKKDINCLREHLLSIIKAAQGNLLCKLFDNGIIQEKDLDLEVSIEHFAGQIRPTTAFDFNEANEEYENETIKTYPKEKSPINIKLSKKPNNEKNPCQFTEDSYHGMLSEARLQTITSDLNYRRTDFQLERMKRKNVSYDFMNTSSRRSEFPKAKQKDIEVLINEYLQTGTATRKFDGIAVKYLNHQAKCSYSGGLNANNTIEAIPIQAQLESNAGDVSLISFDSCDEGKEL